MINGWEEIKFQLAYAAIVASETRRITAANATSGWEEIRYLLTSATIAGLGIKRITVASVENGPRDDFDEIV